ncbi:SsgA family sporulation/cell division regulator [Streptomyces sp. CRN 30]|uniref:SsgA family sporulation/cell division regulator n=1 Tax=Streptomyces sp. CRN 30 TaxID=3075613 RepID=UPI002A812BB8|nr:SsgA family sporulation/cell division regulator [Streptomyces sp. CRN 30]
MPVVEQYARVHVLTDADATEATDGGGDGGRTLPAVFRYDPDDDPGTVRIALAGREEWRCARTLLERGLRGPTGTGTVRVWPCGRVQTVVEFHTARGCSVVQVETRVLLRFLGLTYAPAAFSSAATSGPAVSPPCPPAWTTPAAARSSR